MSSDTKYNGWTNYETWCVNLWMTNDSGGCEQLDENARQCIQDAIEKDAADIRSDAADSLAGMVESQYDEYAEQWMPDQSGIFADFINASLRSVNWHEIARHAIDDIDLYSAGWNMPGYMPDNTPSIFMDADDAMSYLQDSALQHAEDDNDETRADVINDWTVDKNGEFGQTIDNYHYFISKI